MRLPISAAAVGGVAVLAMLSVVSLGGTADAFLSPSLASPRSGAVTSSTRQTTSLYMNKKKKKKTAGGGSKKKSSGSGAAGGKGFGTAASTVLSSALPKSMSSFTYAGTVLPGFQSPQRTVADPAITKPDYAEDGTPKNRPQMLPWVIEQKTPEEIVKMRAAGRVAREVLDIAGRMVKAGITTDEIDAVVRELPGFYVV